MELPVRYLVILGIFTSIGKLNDVEATWSNPWGSGTLIINDVGMEHLPHVQQWTFSRPSYASSMWDKCANIKLEEARQYLNLKRTKHPIKYHHTEEKLKLIKKKVGETCPPYIVIWCKPAALYRSIDGTCNNIRRPLWGAAFTAQLRYLPSAYRDGISLPRTKSVLGCNLPSTRVVSNAVFQTKETIFDPKVTAMHMSFGQFLDHDIVFTPLELGDDGKPPNCCPDGKLNTSAICFSIEVPADDPAIKQKCINVVRSAATPVGGDIGRQQTNEVSAYIDSSDVYGSTEEQMHQLRSHIGGKMKVDQFKRLPEGNTSCIKVVEEDYCQDAGDKRVNVVPNLGAVHWLWVQEHNRIACFFGRFFPFWSDEVIFQETRKIIAAMKQHIVYNEYLPIVLGEAMHDFRLTVPTNGYHYDSNIEAGTANSFGAAAFRFGHSQITNVQITTPIEKTFNRPHMLLRNHGNGYHDVTRWLITAKAARTDNQFESGVRDKLFMSDTMTLDLPAITTQRGRDHGLPSYNQWRQFVGLPKAKSFSGLTEICKTNIAKLKSVYKSVDDIDLFPGALSETPVKGSFVGPTFLFIMGKQFHDYKYGDRFWYENNIGRPHGLTIEQLIEIRKATLARIICNNVSLNKIQRNVFKVMDEKSNPLMSCQNIPDLNLHMWIPHYNHQRYWKNTRHIGYRRW